ncbi:hypothetical protein [Streptomyces sp. NPDC047070]|uniref:hypothetical protein n=1 Tax=Streptomyces sp. NPDC047070 TaxID=3154923 RepID=UPI00345647CE
MSSRFLPQTGIFGAGCGIVPPSTGTFGLAGRVPVQQAATRPARAPRTERLSRIKLAIAAFVAAAGATFGFIATGTDATTAVGVCLSCALAAERLVGMATRPARPACSGPAGKDPEATS